MKRLLIGLLILIGIGAGALLGSSMLTKDNGSELSMTLDNVNPLVRMSTVYGLTNQAIKHSKGQMGEDVYTYRLQTYDAQGKTRTLTFNADKRLKLNHYLKIETKGQNVETWTAVEQATVPTSVVQALVAA